ncbi:MAG: hypothetical protein QW279_13950 [Candidatus Jordarchaeaceae archaeon]
MANSKFIDELAKFRYENELARTDEEEAPASEGYSAMSIEGQPNQFLEQLDPEKICDYIEQILEGKRYDPTTGTWKPVKYAKKISSEGVSEIMLRIRSIINPNTVYSNLDDETIRKITIDFAKELARFLAVNYKKYGMEVADIGKVVNFCANMVYITLARGNEALTIRLIRTAIHTRELITTAPSSEKNKPKSLWEKIGLK